MRKVLEYTFSIVVYIMFLFTFLYAVGFIGGFVVSKTIDSGAQQGGAVALFVDSLLLGLFAIQHSVMARPAFKNFWTTIIPKTVERSIYVLAANICLILLYIFWIPLKAVVWDFTGTFLEAVLWALFALGWLIVLLSTFLINHFELFGLRQTFYPLINKEAPPLGFCKKGLYNYCRHPIMFGFIIAFFMTPKMTVGHLFFAAMATGYIFIALIFEERDLVKFIGDEYKQYQKDVPKVCPFSFGKKRIASKNT